MQGVPPISMQFAHFIPSTLIKLLRNNRYIYVGLGMVLSKKFLWVQAESPVTTSNDGDELGRWQLRRHLVSKSFVLSGCRKRVNAISQTEFTGKL